jgi:hypothetical protein
MKNLTAQFLLLAATALTLQGCWSGGYYPISTVNTNKFIKQRNYETDHPFVLQDNSINAPLVSQKGQINVSAHINNGISGVVTVAVSDKIFVEGGFTHLKNSQLETLVGSFETIENWSDGQSNVFYRSYNYDKMVDINNLTFFAGAGVYKTFGKNGRWENHAGLSYNRAATEYSYIFMPGGLSRYSFEETRKYASLFLQSDFGYVTRKTEGAIIARAKWNYYTDQDFEEQPYISTYEMKKNQVIFQPGFQFAYGGKFRVFTQVTWNIPLGTSAAKWMSTNGKFGIMLKFGEKSAKS